MRGEVGDHAVERTRERARAVGRGAAPRAAGSACTRPRSAVRAR
jgi:hypothetical protein